MNDAAIADILKNRWQGHRDSTYAMLMQLVATNQIPECLHALEQMASLGIGCWRDVRGFIRHFEQHGDTNDGECAVALIQGCVRMTNAQLRTNANNANNRGSLAAKWVPRESKCRGLLQWYYDALAADMFPGAPDAKRRYRKLVSALSPPTTTTPMRPTLAWFVKQALATNDAGKINAMWQQHLARYNATPPLLPVLSLAHSMGPAHNNCLHAGIGLALHLLHLSSAQSPAQILTFSSHAEWHTLENDDFVSQAQQLFRAACSPLNGLNASATSALSAATASAATASAATVSAATVSAATVSAATVSATAKPLLIISDMEHDEPESINFNAQIMTWNVSRNGRPATICGDNPNLLLMQMPQ
jgi:hypothetical protein